MRKACGRLDCCITVINQDIFMCSGSNYVKEAASQLNVTLQLKTISFCLCLLCSYVMQLLLGMQGATVEI